MTTTARAIVIDKPGEHRLVSGPPAVPGPGEARVSVHAAGVCRGDRALFYGTRLPEYVRYPVVPGHEWSGTVDAVGEGVDPALVGRKTVAESLRTCLTCDRCREGATNLCALGYDETGFTRPGGMADVVVVPARLLHLLDDDTDLRSAALLATAAVSSAAVLAGRPCPGQRVAVVGADTPGLLAVQLLSASSPTELLVTDSHRERAERARAVGADHALSPMEARKVRGRFDLVIDIAGEPGTAQDACLLARPGGQVVLAGMYEPGALRLDPLFLMTSQLTVRSVFGASSAAWTYAVRALASGLLDPASLITDELPLTAFPEAVALAGGGRPDVGKVLLVP